MLLTILNNTEAIMAQIDDLAALLTTIQTGITAVKTEVTDLIAKLTAVPAPTDLTAVIAQAQGIATMLASIPAEPK